MCDQDAKAPLAALFNLTRLPAEVILPGSRRRRLWELPKSAHCPVIGVCLPLGLLRRLVNKALKGQAQADDYALHVGAVSECASRSPLSELLQRELEQRYAGTIQRFRTARSQTAVAALWADAVAAGDVCGALWASLTHPRCDVPLQEAICRDMHMLQHQAGAAVRVDLQRFQQLQDENLALGRELADVQQRITRLLQDKQAELDQLTAALMQARADAIGKDTRIAALAVELQQLHARIPGLHKRNELAQRLEQMVERNRELERRNTALAQQRDRLAASEAPPAADPVAATPAVIDPAPPAIALQQQQVLCVGGRNGNVCSYRELIERSGGHFLHHDGGQEASINLLDASLAAADLVICQTGCISHNAYWRVKDYCKRTGKPCVFIDNPSISSLARGLAACRI